MQKIGKATAEGPKNVGIEEMDPRYPHFLLLPQNWNTIVVKKLMLYGYRLATKLIFCYN